MLLRDNFVESPSVRIVPPGARMKIRVQIADLIYPLKRLESLKGSIFKDGHPKFLQLLVCRIIVRHSVGSQVLSQNYQEI